MKPTAEEINKITVLEDVGNVSEWLRAINKVAQGSEPEAGVWALNSTLPSCHPSRYRRLESLAIVASWQRWRRVIWMTDLCPQRQLVDRLLDLVPSRRS